MINRVISYTLICLKLKYLEELEFLFNLLFYFILPFTTQNVFELKCNK